MVSVSASVNLPLHHEVQKFSSGTGSPGWSRKKDRKTVVVVVFGNMHIYRDGCCTLSLPMTHDLLAISKFLESVTEWSRMVCEGEQFVVLELPLLFESGKMLRFIDTVIVVYWFVLVSYLVKNVPNTSRDTVAMYLRRGGIFIVD